MDIPHRGPRALPEIHVHGSNPSDRFYNASRSNSYSSVSSPSNASGPMPIPNAQEPVPPPLPPPRNLADIADSGHNGNDIAWQWGNSRENGGWGGSISSVPPGSSLYRESLAGKKSMDDRPEFVRRTSSTSTVKSISGLERQENSYPRIDEGYASLSGTSIGSNRSKYLDSQSARAGFQSSVHDKFRSNAQAYDKSQLQRLDPRMPSDNTTPPRRYSKSPFSTSLTDGSPTSRIALEHRYPPQLKALSLPIITGRPGPVESPLARWAETPLSAVSPGNSYPRFGTQSQFDYRSPTDTTDADSVTTRESYDQRVSPDHDIDFQMEEAGLRRLHIEDYATRPDAYSISVTAGQKRRASSPPRDDGPLLHTVGSQSDLFRRRESASRTSPGPRFHSTSGSISSTASGPRNNSYASTLSALSIAPSSITSMNSFGRLSPGGISPVPTDGSDSPYVTSLSLDPSPRGSISRPNHQRTVSETRPLMTSRKLSDNISHAKQNTIPKMQGVYICECCPKKPKKFDSQEELNTHEQEKQYECAYCRNRFKNKNEAERHQNSLHLRRHSWSCAALSGYPAAFHVSPTRPNEADTCGYCGEDFPRSGISSPSPSGHRIVIATEQDWEARVVHLQDMHKFGECNHAKKFFRADHFRQHLKHSHAGTSGKWTNMLENACMKDEPLPEPIRGPERASPGGSRVGRINEEDEIL